MKNVVDAAAAGAISAIFLASFAWIIFRAGLWERKRNLRRALRAPERYPRWRKEGLAKWRDHLKCIEEVFSGEGSIRPFSSEELLGISAFAPDLGCRLEKYRQLCITEAIQKTRQELENPQGSSETLADAGKPAAAHRNLESSQPAAQQEIAPHQGSFHGRLDSMKKPTQYLLIGFTLGVVAIAIGHVVSIQLSQNVEALISECKAVHLKPMPTNAPPWDKDPLVCEPQELESPAVASNGKLGGVQASIIETLALSRAWKENSRYIGVLLFVIFGLPLGWQFLLRRIAELRQALVGR